MLKERLTGMKCIVCAVSTIIVFAGIAPAGIVTTGDADISGSNWYIGSDAAGTLTVDDGSTATTTGIGYLGQNAGGSGSATIDGTGSIWATGSFRVGMLGYGELFIQDGGAVTATGESHIGLYSTANNSALVTGSGSSITVSHYLNIATASAPTYPANGQLTISNQGVVTAERIFIGRNGGATGLVTVDGDGSKLVSSVNDVVVGTSGEGELVIQNSGLVVAPLLRIGWQTGSSGVVKMQSGGKLALSDAGGSTASSLTEFLGRIDSYSASTMQFQYFNTATGLWDDINNASADDYTLQAGTGDLADYTVLTVPEPFTALIMAASAPLLLKRRKK
jgi:T5SS/PEP-CTERM-associated repeat protein